MFLKILFLPLLAGSIIAGDIPCQTPDGKHGYCKPLKECESIKAKDPKFVTLSHCGFVGTEPKVCCCGSPQDNQNGSDFVTNELLPGKDVCGLDNELPWLVGLEFQRSDGNFGFRCLGALISRRYVLTAAYCTDEHVISVRLGDLNFKNCENQTCVRNPIEKFIKFESNEERDHDIALVRMKEEVTFSDHIKPICLPTTVDDLYESYIGQRLTLTSWRSPKKDEEKTKIKIDVPVQELSKCKYTTLHSGLLCAGGEEGKDACDGDGGAPLIALRPNAAGKNQWYVVAVVGFGPVPCAQKDKPSVYTRVSKYVSWISDNLKP